MEATTSQARGLEPLPLHLLLTKAFPGPNCLQSPTNLSLMRVSPHFLCSKCPISVFYPCQAYMSPKLLNFSNSPQSTRIKCISWPLTTAPHVVYVPLTWNAVQILPLLLRLDRHLIDRRWRCWRGDRNTTWTNGYEGKVRAGVSIINHLPKVRWAKF